MAEQIKPRELLYFRLDSYLADAKRKYWPAHMMNLMAVVASDLDRWPALRQALTEIKAQMVDAGLWDDMLAEIDTGIEAYLRHSTEPRV